MLAYSSSRIHVLDVTWPEVVVKRELKILRRPASTTITDDGLTLAVLATDLQVDLYDLSGDRAKHTRVVSLDHAPRTIALSPNGSVLAAAYDSGIEVSSLDPDCISTERRAVKCYAVDSLSFSRDGTQLLGSTIQSRNPSTVVLTAPYHNPGSALLEESISAMWTASILFPNGSRDCSHAVLLPSPSDVEASWTFTYDRVFETFRAVRIDDLRNGTTYFTGPMADLGTLLPSTLPAASEAGHLVTAGFQEAIWLYGIPEDLEAIPINNGVNSNTESEVSTPSSPSGRTNSAPWEYSSPRARESTSRTPQWQLPCDKSRNTFVEGRKITSLVGVSAMSWVSDNSISFHKERLVAVAPGVSFQSAESEDDGMSPTDGGRISILDFDYSTNDGKRTFITVEVGNKEPDVLEEEQRDIATEVALVRRRTVAQRRGAHSDMTRSATTLARPVRAEPSPMPPLPTMTTVIDLMSLPPLGTGRPSQAITTDQSETALIDEDEAFDAPYSQTSPRSGTTLRRAATAAATNRRLHPRAIAQDHIEYRRADGREEHPHESDADNWVPPPPPYTKETLPPLPDHIQRSILAEKAAETLERPTRQHAPSLDFPGLDGLSLQRSRTFSSVSSVESRRFPLSRARSDSITTTIGAYPIQGEAPQSLPDRDVGDYDELYDVSPPGSPQPTPPSPEVPIQAVLRQIPRRPVGTSVNNSNGPAISPVSPPRATRSSTQQPVAPVPQPQTSPESLRRLLDWESTSNDTSGEVSESSHPHTPRAPVSPGLAMERMALHAPCPPPEDAHPSESLSTSPVIVDRRQNIESQPIGPSRRGETEPTYRWSIQTMTRERPSIWQRAGLASPPTQVSNTNPVSPNLVMPSADQMARLNSRRGRPSSQPLLYPSRRISGSFPQPQPQTLATPSSGPSSWDSAGPAQNTPPQMSPEPPFRSTPPRAAVGAQGHPPNSYNNHPLQHGNNISLQHPNIYASQQSQQWQPKPTTSSWRRVSLGPQSLVRQTSSSSPNLRAPLQRLDTIHSISSNGGEPSTWMSQKQMTVGRQPSRAERGAAKNIKDAKTKGWRARMTKEGNHDGKASKEKWGDGASSAGWTDISRESGTRSAGRLGERQNGGKCRVM